SMRSRVDFPQPDGPTSTANWPSSMSMSTPRMTCVPPKYFCIARICTDAMRRSFVCLCYLRMTAPSFCHNISGPARMGPIDQILCGLAPQLALGCYGIEGGVGRQQYPGMLDDARIRLRRFDRQDVQPCPIQQALSDRIEQGGGIDHLPARRIDQHAAQLHQGQA